MRVTRSMLLAGTMLPALLLAGPAPAGSLGAEVGTRLLLAQLDGPGGEPGPRGGRGGGAERGGPERGGPERGGGLERGGPDRGARERPERPEPRQAPAARERPEPQERAAPPAARERPERPERQERPERPEPRQAPAARERPEPQERAAPPAARERPDRPERPQRQEAPAARERPDAPDRTAPAPAQREDREPTQRGRGTDRDENQTPDRSPAQQRQERQERTPDRTQDRDGDGRRDRPGRGQADEPARTTPAQPGAPGATQAPAGQPAAPNQRPGVPGRPVQAPNATQPGAQPNAAPPGQAPQPGTPAQPPAPGAAQPPAAAPAAPNQRPGVPGRPVQDPNAVQPGAQPNAVSPGQPPQPAAPGQPPAPNAAQPSAGQPVVPSDRPGVPGRPAPDPNVPPAQPNAVQQGQGQYQRDGRGDDRRDRFNVPGRPGYVPGGFRNDDYEYRDYDRVRRDRREYDIDGRSYYREPGRIIVRDRDGYFIRHDETERFRYLDQRGFRSERRGYETYSYLDRPGGEQIVTVVDDDGRLLRRYRRYRDGREVVIINNSYGPGGPRPIYEDVVDLPPPDIRIPRDRYVVDYERADPRVVYETLRAGPVVPIDRRYTLDQVRYSPQLRARMPSIDINTITFDTGSFTVDAEQARKLQVIADGINRAIKDNPQEVFLIEGYTDAVGADVDNLSLSDRRAQSVATVLTQTFNVPPENLTTQGYGEQNLKVNTQEANRENRRVTVRRITPLLQQQSEVDQGQTQAPPPR